MQCKAVCGYNRIATPGEFVEIDVRDMINNWICINQRFKWSSNHKMAILSYFC